MTTIVLLIVGAIVCAIAVDMLAGAIWPIYIRLTTGRWPTEADEANAALRTVVPPQAPPSQQNDSC